MPVSNITVPGGPGDGQGGNGMPKQAAASQASPAPSALPTVTANGFTVVGAPPPPRPAEHVPTTRVAMSLIKTAQWNSVSMSAPFFSPIHTPQQWQIASKRREIYMWARHWYENEPKVAAGIDFYAQFPMCGFKLECKSSKVKRYFEKLVKDLRLAEWLTYISHEYFLIGDVFPFLEIECPVCGGSGLDPDDPTGQTVCNHPGGTFRRMAVLNPDYVEVQKTHLDDRPDIYQIADEQLTAIVQKRIEPLYSRLHPSIRDAVARRMPMRLSPRCVSHIAHNKAPYGLYGQSLLRRLFTTLSYKAKLTTANWIVAERLVLPIRVVKMGSENRPATGDDIADMQQQLLAIQSDPNMTIITPAEVEFDWVGATGRIHNLQGEFEAIGKEILDGFMLNQALLNGEMGHYSSAQVGVEAILHRLEAWRTKLANWVYDHVFEPVARMQGFIDEQKTREYREIAQDDEAEPMYLFPTLKWNDMQLRDNSQQMQMYIQLNQEGKLSNDTLLKKIDLDWDEEVEKMRAEQVTVGQNGAMGQGGGAGGMGGGAPMGGGGGGAPPGGMDPSGGMGGGMPGGMDPSGGMGMGAPGGAPGGAAPGGGMGAAAGAMGRIEKRGKAKKPDEDAAQQPQTSTVRMTKLEAKVLRAIQQIGIPHTIYAQFQVPFPGNTQPYVMDFAIPELKVDVECVRPEQPIQTARGLIEAKDVVVGDRLIGRDGSDVEVRRIFRNPGRDSLLRMRAMGCLPMDVTGDHPMLVSKPRHVRVYRDEPSRRRTREYVVPGDLQWLPASEVNVGDFLLLPKRKVREVSEIDLSAFNSVRPSWRSKILPERVTLDRELGRLVGLYAAEGSTTGSSVTFSFDSAETELVEEVREILRSRFGTESSLFHANDDDSVRVNTCHLALGKFLSQCGKVAHEKRLPQFVFDAPADFVSGLLSGLVDGDGCRDEGRKERIVSSSRSLLLDVQRLLASRGEFGRINLNREPGALSSFGERSYETKGLWEIAFCDDCHAKPQFREDDDFFYVPVKEVSEVEGADYTVNFETSGEGQADHTFVISNLVTHNCDGRIWHDDEESNDRERDQKLASLGWRVLRFREEAINEQIDAVKHVIHANVYEAEQERRGGSRKNASRESDPADVSRYEIRGDDDGLMGVVIKRDV